eukprot:1170613-Pyramimonas_sp.AAC.1
MLDGCRPALGHRPPPHPPRPESPGKGLDSLAPSMPRQLNGIRAHCGGEVELAVVAGRHLGEVQPRPSCARLRRRSEVEAEGSSHQVVGVRTTPLL